MTTALRELGVGRSSALVIEGEAGIGKTRLVQELVDRAHARGVTVCGAGAHPFERTRPFGVVAAALDLTRRSPDARKAAIGALLAGQPTDGSPPAGSDLQHHVVELIVDVVERSSAEQPVLLVTEDVHWADSASLRTISSVARQLVLSPVLVVVTARPAPLSPDAIRLLEDLMERGAERVRLEPLTDDDVAALARHELGAPAGPALSVLLAKAGGNPLWTVAILRSLADEGLLEPTDDGIEATTAELPASVNDLVTRRLRQFPASTLELLQVTAVLGDAVSLRDVASVARRSPTDVVAQLRKAFDAQLLDEDGDRVVFRHQLVHDAIYQTLPAPIRRVWHREAAQALTAAGADPLEVADHLMLGAERGDAQAVASLREAARAASGQAPSVAVDLLLRAEALLPTGHDDADLVAVEAVYGMLRAGRVADASTRAEAVLARPHADEVRTPMRLALMGALALQNRAPELVAVIEAALADPAGLQPYEEVPMLAQQSWALTYSGDHRAGESAARRALDIAETTGSAALIVWALTSLLVAEGRRGGYGEALAHAQRAAALADSPEVRALPIQPKFMLGLTLFDCDRVDEARAAYREALADEFGSAWWLSDTLVADAQAMLAIGEWEDAVPALIASGEAAVEKDHPLLLSQSVAHRAIIATASGEHRAARDLVATIAGFLEGDTLSYNAGVIASAVSGAKVVDGDQQGAYDLLLRCWRFEAARGDRFYHRSIAADLVRLALALGHREVAAEASAAVAAGAALAPEVATLRSLALRCQGMVDGDGEPMIEAVEVARGVPFLVDHAGACEDAAAVLAATGRRDEAVRFLQEALERYERVGADGWASRVRSALRTHGVRPGRRGPRNRPATGWASLTTTEQAVTLLVAEGLTNGAVAKRLYISPHTVNTHLRHVFTKLDVSNRVELTSVVHRSIE